MAAATRAATEGEGGATAADAGRGISRDSAAGIRATTEAGFGAGGVVSGEGAAARITGARAKRGANPGIASTPLPGRRAGFLKRGKGGGQPGAAGRSAGAAAATAGCGAASSPEVSSLVKSTQRMSRQRGSWRSSRAMRAPSARARLSAGRISPFAR